MNRKVYILAVILVVLAGTMTFFKMKSGASAVRAKNNPHLWRVSVVMNLTGQGARGKARLTLPRSNPHQTIYNVHFETDDMLFYTRETKSSGNIRGYWKSELLEGGKSVHYTFSAETHTNTFQIPPYLIRPSNPLEFYPPEFHDWLEPSAFIQSADLNIQKHLKKVIKKDKTVSGSLRKIYDFVRGEVAYKSEKGSKNALQTLSYLEADCGGKARLFAAFSRAAGIPSRVVGGLLLKSGTKSITHVWVENYIDGQWIPFDVVNDYFAVLPDYYLELYRGDISLIQHLGLKKIEYYFVISPENVPPLDNPWSLYTFPTHFQGMIKILLLIPLGALIVAFFRTIIGVPTFGTFTPILLSLALRQVPLSAGLTSLFAIIFFGWLMRKLLDNLKILVIPRLAVVLTLVVVMVLGIMIVSYHLGDQKVLFISLFPMVIMTWMVERFSVLEIEDGTLSALQTALGSVFVSTVTYFIFSLNEVRAYMFAFPEILLVIMALLLVMGRYTGYRLMELLRFKEILKTRKAKTV